MLKLYPKNNPPQRIKEVVDILNDGGVIIYPTGTTYAFGCHALKERAVERICKIRQIDPATHPLSVICYDMSSISEYAQISNAIIDSEGVIDIEELKVNNGTANISIAERHVAVLGTVVFTDES